MRALSRAFDWSTTSLGSVSQWSQPLHTAAQLVLASPFPNILLWGPELIQIYNDGYRELMGNKHPAGLGQPTQQCWPEVWPINEPIYQRVWAGESFAFENALYPINRSGQLQDAWFTLAYSPVLDEMGQVGGILVTVFETTQRVLEQQNSQRAQLALAEQEKQQAFLLKLSDALRPLSDSAEIELTAMRLLGQELGVNRAFFATIDADGETWSIQHDYADGVASHTGRYPMSEFQRSRMVQWQAGRMSSIADSEADHNLSVADRAAYAAFDTRAAIGVPLVKGGRFAALLSVNQSMPRVWREEELALTSEVAERTWVAVERARSEEALRQSEEKYRTLFDSIDEAFALIEVIVDESGNPVDLFWLETNAVFERHTGFIGTGKKMSQVTGEVESFWYKLYDRVLKTGEPQRVEYAVEKLGKWYRAYLSRASGEGSHQVALVFDDITERKRREAHQTLLVEIGDDLSRLVTPDEIMQTVGERLGDYLKLGICVFVDVDEVQGQVTVHHGWHKEGVKSLEQQTFRMSEYTTEEFRRASRAGEIFIIRDTANDARVDGEAYARLNVGAWLGVPFHRAGRWTAFLSVTDTDPRDWQADEIELVRNIAERVFPRIERARAEEALQQSEARQRAILESAKDYAIFTTDLGRCVTSWNKGAQALFGYEEEQILHQSADVLYTPADRQQEAPQREAQKAIRAGQAENERWHCRADGSRFYGSGVVTPLRDEAGSVIGLLKVVRDLTAQKRSEEALKQADLRKDEFLAMLAHELRNPLATIRSGLQILTLTDGKNETIGPPDSSATLAMMNRQTDHLVRMVDDLLDVSRISQGKIELRKQRINLVEVVAQAAESLQAFYQEQGRRLQVDLPTAPIEVEGDVARLNQVVTNLLINGVRYSEESGQVWLRLTHQAGVSRRGTADHGPSSVQEALIQVRDNGIGLAADQLKSIFELFVQVDNSLARSKGGLGLGLTLVKRLAELHGGRVKAQSEGLGKGSTFTVYLPTLPAVTQPVPATTPQTADAGASRRILVVDDNADASFTLAMLLKLKGYEVHTRHSGRAGIEAAEQLQPWAILLDIGMPELDGYATCRFIRQQVWGQDIVVIALTGYGQDEDRQRTREVGFDGHLVKPVDLEALLDLLTELPENDKMNP